MPTKQLCLLRFRRRALTGAVMVLLLPVVAAAQSTVRWATNYYAVTGATMVDVRRSLDLAKQVKGRGTMDALTAWQIDWHFTVTSTASGCRCSAFTSKTIITTTLPFWKPTGAVASQDKTTWQHFFRTLAQHEAGHAQNALRAAAEIQSCHREISEDQDCNTMKRKITELAQRIMDDHRKWDKDYDLRTGHGARQGAAFP